MFKRITIKNFQAHKKLELSFDPHVTTIVGPSDVGKSAVIRAIAWLATNRPSGTEFIRDGAKTAIVELEIDGHTIRRERSKSLNLYVLDGQEFKTDDCQETPWKLSAAIIVRGEQAGQVEVGYLEERPEADEGPFLEEERLLLGAVAERLGRITERKRAEDALQQALGAAERARRLEAARRQEAERRREIAEVLGEVVTALNSDEALGEVLHLIAQGATNREISEQLVITVGTVKSHINHILGKLDAHNRTEAVARARVLGLLEI